MFSKNLDKILGSFTKTLQDLDVFIKQTDERQAELEVKKAQIETESFELTTKKYKAQQVHLNLTKLLG